MAEISAKPSSFYGLYRECIASRIHAPTSRRHGVPYPLPPTYPLGVTDTPLRHWHGGAPGLRAGDVLLPPIETGLIFTRLTMSLEEGQTEIGQRPDRVYVSTDRELAWAYASAWTLDGRCRGRIAIPSRGESPRARRGLAVSTRRVLSSAISPHHRGRGGQHPARCRSMSLGAQERFRPFSNIMLVQRGTAEPPCGVSRPRLEDFSFTNIPSCGRTATA